MAISSIGTAARDYSTITAWEADLGAGSQAGECYNDSEFDESVTLDDADPDDITLTVASGERHDGTAGTGARIVGSSTRLMTLDNSIDMDVQWLELDDSRIVSEVNVGVSLREMKRLLVHGVSSGSLDIISGSQTNGDLGHRLINSVIYGNDLSSSINRSAVESFDTVVTSAFDSGVWNSTIHANTNSGSGTMSGVNVQSEPNKYVQNTIATDHETDFESDGGNADHNASSDSTASGTGSLTNITTADQYVSTTPGSEDLHLKAGADCIDAGTDLGTTPSGVELDIDGRDRDAEGDTWDMGADEFVAPPGGGAGLFGRIARQMGGGVVGPLSRIAG